MENVKVRIIFDDRGRTRYQPGDIVGVRGGKGPLTWLSYHAITPHTPLFHFFIIGDYIQEDDDYVILESIGKGVAVGRLSWYRNREYSVFRLNFEQAAVMGRRVSQLASKFGRRRYDWKLYVKLFAWALAYWTKEIATLHIPPRAVFPSQIPYDTDRDFICIELVFETWNLAGFHIRDSGHAPVPAEIVMAVDRGDLVKIDVHNGDPSFWRQFPSPLYTGARQIVAGERLGKGDLVKLGQNGKTYKVDNPGPDIIGRPKGQKRNRVHVYRQPFGYPIRLCDWKAEDVKNIEVIGQVQRITEPGAPMAIDTALDWVESMKGVAVCKHCRRVVQGLRETQARKNRGHGTGAPLP